MASKMLARTVVMLLMLVGLSASSPGGAALQQSGERSIVLIQDSGRPIEIQFSDADLARVASDPKYVLERMRIGGILCCGQKKRITQYIWVCCNGNRIRTSNRTLVSALERVWGV